MCSSRPLDEFFSVGILEVRDMLPTLRRLRPIESRSPGYSPVPISKTPVEVELALPGDAIKLVITAMYPRIL